MGDMNMTEEKTSQYDDPPPLLQLGPSVQSLPMTHYITDEQMENIDLKLRYVRTTVNISTQYASSENAKDINKSSNINIVSNSFKRCKIRFVGTLGSDAVLNDYMRTIDNEINTLITTQPTPKERMTKLRYIVVLIGKIRDHLHTQPTISITDWIEFSQSMMEFKSDVLGLITIDLQVNMIDNNLFDSFSELSNPLNSKAREINTAMRDTYGTNVEYAGNFQSGNYLFEVCNNTCETIIQYANDKDDERIQDPHVIYRGGDQLLLYSYMKMGLALLIILYYDIIKKAIMITTAAAETQPNGSVRINFVQFSGLYNLLIEAVQKLYANICLEGNQFCERQFYDHFESSRSIKVNVILDALSPSTVTSTVNPMSSQAKLMRKAYVINSLRSRAGDIYEQLKHKPIHLLISETCDYTIMLNVILKDQFIPRQTDNNVRLSQIFGNYYINYIRSQINNKLNQGSTCAVVQYFNIIFGRLQQLTARIGNNKCIVSNHFTDNNMFTIERNQIILYNIKRRINLGGNWSHSKMGGDRNKKQKKQQKKDISKKQLITKSQRKESVLVPVESGAWELVPVLVGPKEASSFLIEHEAHHEAHNNIMAAVPSVFEARVQDAQEPMVTGGGTRRKRHKLHKKHKTKRHKRHKKRPTKRHKRRKSHKKRTTKHH